MAPPVWVLSVDLQTKTASFQTGMAEAAKTARYTFGSIGTDARNSGKEVQAGTIETRSALGLFDAAIRGEHSMAMSDFIRLFEKSSAVMALIPFAAVAGGAIVLGEAIVGIAHHMQEMKEQEEALARSLTNFGTIGQNAFNGMDEKILQSGIKADELRNDHLGALAKQLKLIDMQSMGDLEKSFDALGKEAASVFAQLKTSWYQFGIGAAGAKHALDTFTSQYDSLLAKGKGGEASSLLKGTSADAEHVLAMMKQAKDNSGGFFSGPKQGASFTAAAEALATLKKAGVGYTEKEIQAQEILVAALKDQEGIEARTNALKKQDQDNAKRTTAGDMSSEHSAGQKAAAASMLQMGQQALTAEKAVADARLAVQRASIQARTQSDLDFASREYQMQLAANDQQIKALDKYAKDYPNLLKEMHNKALEITQSHETAIAEITSKAQIAQNALDLANIEAGERQKIDATQQGSSARLAAIDVALKEERTKNMQDLAVYKALQTERVNVARQMAEEASKKQADATDVQAQALQKLAEAEAQAKAKTMQAQGHGEPMHLAQLAQAQKISDMEYGIKRDALQKELMLYQQAGAQRVQDAAKTAAQLAVLDKQHTLESQENQQQENASFKSSCAQMEQAYAQSFLQIAQGHQTLTQVMGRLVEQSVQKTLAGLIAEANGQKAEQMAFAKTAATKAWSAMSGIPLIGPALGAVAAAATFAGAMAFNTGTDYVRGMGHADTVPAMLTPGEGIVPGGVMDGLRTMARNGTMSGNTTTNHFHHHATYHVNTIDGDGMKDVLDKHSDQLHEHFNNHVRKMNK